MSIFRNIKHWLQTKIYHAVINIQRKIDEEKLSNILYAMRRTGEAISIRNDAKFDGMEYMEIGNNFYSGKNAWVEAIDQWKSQKFQPRLKIGDNFSMQHNCHIGCIERVEIGDDVLLGSKVYITDHFHGNATKDDVGVPPIDRPLSSKPVKRGCKVLIGDNVTILPGVTIGDNVIVGANAVVTKSFPANAVIAGCPAKLLRML